MTIGKKLFCGVGALLLFTFALGIMSYLDMSSVGKQLHIIVEERSKKEALAREMHRDAAILLSTSRGALMRASLHDVEGMKQDEAEFASVAHDMSANLETLKPLLTRGVSKTSLQDLAKATAAMYAAHGKMLDALKTGDITSATNIFDASLHPAEKQMEVAAEGLLKAQRENLSSDSKAAMDDMERARWVSAGLLGLSCAVGLTLIFVVRQINALLHVTVSQLSVAAEEISSSSNEVADSSQSMAQGASKQAAMIQETSSASTEINSMAQRSLENSRTTAEMMTESQKRFDEANQSLQEMLKAMDEITASSQKISQIIKVIDEIAFQTNILALNAAVEAARAGEAGLGFAVVADEVRNLAQRSAQAARDTASLIEESIERSNGGKVKVDQVASSIGRVTSESNRIKLLVDEINLGSTEQSRGIDQIARSISAMEQVTMASAAGADQGAAAADRLSGQAATMQDIVVRIRTMVDGAAAQHQNTLDPKRSATPKPGARPAKSTGKVLMRPPLNPKLQAHR